MLAPAALLASSGAAGCGGGRAAPAATAPSRAAQATGARYATPGELSVGIGNGFRDGLYRLAVMAQADDDAKDLGQPLATGTVQRVRCTPRGGRPPGDTPWNWRCTVRWRSASDRPARTRYAVRVTPEGCFAAGADPRRGARYDATIHSFAADPLDTLVSARPGC